MSMLFAAVGAVLVAYIRRLATARGAIPQTVGPGGRVVLVQGGGSTRWLEFVEGHFAAVVVTEGESFRMREARTRGSGQPKKT